MIRVRSSDGGEQRRRDDVHAGDEAGHARRGVGEPDGLQDLRDAVERARGRPPARRASAESRSSAGRDDEQQHGGDREPQRQEVDRRHPVEQVVDQEERRCPSRR